MWHHLSRTIGRFPGAGVGYTAIRHVCPTRELLCGSGLCCVKDKSSTVMPCSVKFVPDVLCQGVDATAHIDGFYNPEYVISRQQWKSHPK